MNELSSDAKLLIANSGGYFEENGETSWRGIKVRRGDKSGVVVRDANGAYRVLTVKFEDGEEEIKMNNLGRDPEYIHEYEWYDKSRDQWYRF